MSPTHRPALVADVGGTSARFAILDRDGALQQPITLESRGFEDLAAPVEHAFSIYGKTSGQPLAAADGALSIHGTPMERPTAAAVAVAGPVTGDLVELTNVGWRFSIEESRRALGLERLVVINDLEAVAWSLRALDAAWVETLLAGRPEPVGEALQPRVEAIVGVGTGLGVAALRTSPRGEEAILATEGGHRDLAAATAREWAVVEALSRRFGGHVSAERAVSGPGLAALYQALAALDSGAGVSIAPDEVAMRAETGDEPARETLRLFSGFLGAIAGDLALTLGARGGIWIAGGVVPGLGPAFDRRAFVERFLDKGRFRGWLEAVPVRLVLDPLCALRGAARALRASD